MDETPTAPSHPRLLSVEEMSSELGGIVAPRTLRNWCYERRIPCVRIGRKYAFRREHIERILNMLEQKTVRAMEIRAA